MDQKRSCGACESRTHVLQFHYIELKHAYEKN